MIWTTEKTQSLLIIRCWHLLIKMKPSKKICLSFLQLSITSWWTNKVYTALPVSFCKESFSIVRAFPSLAAILDNDAYYLRGRFACARRHFGEHFRSKASIRERWRSLCMLNTPLVKLVAWLLIRMSQLFFMMKPFLYLIRHCLMDWSSEYPLIFLHFTLSTATGLYRRDKKRK